MAKREIAERRATRSGRKKLAGDETGEEKETGGT
jgi:hypothetical protein